jgi:hypothetical protein
MKGILKRDELMAARMEAGQFHCGFDRLGSGVSKKTAPRLSVRHQRFELSRKIRHLPVVEVGPGHVNERLGLLLDGAHDIRMAVPGGANGYTRVEVEESISIDVFHNRTPSTGGDQWV